MVPANDVDVAPTGDGPRLRIRTSLPTGVTPADLELALFVDPIVGRKRGVRSARQQLEVGPKVETLGVSAVDGDLMVTLPALARDRRVIIRLTDLGRSWSSGCVFMGAPRGAAVPLLLDLRPIGKLEVRVTSDHRLPVERAWSTLPGPTTGTAHYGDDPCVALFHPAFDSAFDPAFHMELKTADGSARSVYTFVLAGAVTVTCGELRSETQDVYCTVQPGQRVEVDVVLRSLGELGTISGSITLEGPPLKKGGTILLQNSALPNVSFRVGVSMLPGRQTFFFENVPLGEYLVTPFPDGFIHCTPRALTVSVPASGVDFVMKTGAPRRHVAFHVVDAVTLEPIDEYWTEYARQGRQPRRVVVSNEQQTASYVEGAKLDWTVRRPGYAPAQGSEDAFVRAEERSTAQKWREGTHEVWIAEVMLRPIPGAEAARAKPMPRARH